jgi:hypothetical protein
MNGRVSRPVDAGDAEQDVSAVADRGRPEAADGLLGVLVERPEPCSRCVEIRRSRHHGSYSTSGRSAERVRLTASTSQLFDCTAESGLGREHRRLSSGVRLYLYGCPVPAEGKTELDTSCECPRRGLAGRCPEPAGGLARDHSLNLVDEWPVARDGATSRETRTRPGEVSRGRSPSRRIVSSMSPWWYRDGRRSEAGWSATLPRDWSPSRSLATRYTGVLTRSRVHDGEDDGAASG